MKNKTLCLVSTHVKIFYDNGILNLKYLYSDVTLEEGNMLSDVRCTA